MNNPQVDERIGNIIKNKKSEFICGVVEGFYGKPWTFEQRKDLFKRLRDLKLNSFMYAPKDDTKHRAKWRQLYSDYESNLLRILIHEAKVNGIDFYYSLAPGLDMVYSDRDEIELMLRKYDQLVGLGCESFAILFDDIEPTINERDRDAFKNYAAAQVSVTNVVFEHLNRPKFLFCPTEYCESRAVPSVSNSCYLNTIGAGLLGGIDIMWSGPRVISRFITEESIETLTKVIQRPPVIWENLHANDYDKKRVFLGPYSGRSTKIIPKLRGVLTNPNCEYEANYVAIHTLARWSKCTEDINLHNRSNPMDRRPSDLAMNIGGGGGEQRTTATSKLSPLGAAGDDNITSKIYDPDRALMAAIKDWLPYICERRSLPMGINLSVHSKERNDDAANTQLGVEEQLPQTTNEPIIVNKEAVDATTNMEMMDEETVSSTGSNTKSDMDMSSSPAPLIPSNIETNSCDSCDMQDATEQQVKGTHHPTGSAINKGSDLVAGGDGANVGTVDCLMCSMAKQATKTTTVTSASAGVRTGDSQVISDQLSLDNLSILVDLFYLPFEHGLHGCALLRELEWLKDNSDNIISENIKSKDDHHHHPAAAAGPEVHGKQVLDPQGRLTASKEVQNEMNVDHSDHQAAMNQSSSSNNNNSSREQQQQQQQHHQQSNTQVVFWLERAEKLNNLCTCINRLVNTLIHDCPNKLLIMELYPYLAEMRDVISMITDYVKFLRYRSSNLDRFYYSNSLKHSTKEATSSDEQEPWVHRGGLIGDVQRLLS